MNGCRCTHIDDCIQTTCTDKALPNTIAEIPITTLSVNQRTVACGFILLCIRGLIEHRFAAGQMNYSLPRLWASPNFLTQIKGMVTIMLHPSHGCKCPTTEIVIGSWLPSPSSFCNGQ